MSTPLISQMHTRFTPASISAYERKPLWRLSPGDRVLWAMVRKITLADADTLSRISLGTWDDPDGLITAAVVDEPTQEATPDGTGDLDLEEGRAGDLIDGTGALLQKSGGVLILAPDHVYATYEPGLTANDYGTTLPTVEFTVAVVRNSV